jgi:hypothetical protein
VGNQVVVGALQAKLEVGSSADGAEREADAVADEVMRRLAGGPSVAATVDVGSATPARHRAAQRAVQSEEATASTVGPAGGALDAETEGAGPWKAASAPTSPASASTTTPAPIS